MYRPLSAASPPIRYLGLAYAQQLTAAPRWLRYSVAMAFFLIALMARFGLDDMLPASGFPFLTFYPAILLAVYLAGLGPGLLTSALSVLAAWFVFLPPEFSFSLTDSGLVALVFFSAILLINCGVIHVMKAALAHVNRTEQQLRESSQRLGWVLDNLYTYVGLLDLDGTLREVNEEPLRVATLSRDELLGQPLWDAPWWAGDTRRQSEVRSAIARAASGETVRFDIEVKRSGQQYSIDFQVGPLRDSEGKITALVASGVNVSARVEAMQALQRSRLEAVSAAEAAEAERRLLDAIFNAVPASIVVADANGKLLRMNPALEQIWGIAPFSKDVAGYGEWKGWWADGSARHGQPIQPHEWGLARSLQGETCNDIVEVEPFGRPGERLVTLLSAAPVRDASGQVVGGVVAQVDITHRLNAEKALRASNARFRALFDSGPVAIHSCDATGRLQEYNPCAARLWGRQPKHMDSDERYSGAHKLFLPDGTLLLPAQSPMSDVLNGKIAAVYDKEFVIERLDGSRSTVIANIVPLKNDREEITGGMCCFYDITERKNTEDALRESEARYHSLFNSIDEGFCVIDMMFDAHDKPVDYRFMEVNPAFAQQTGLHGATGRRMREIAPDIEAHWFEIYGEVALTGQPVRFTSEAKALSGRWFDVYAFRLGAPENRKVAVIFNNITERKKAEVAMRQSEERLRLAAEVAHFGMYDRDMYGAYFHVSGQLKQILGYEPDALLDHAQVMSHIHPDDRLSGVAAFQRACDPAGDGHLVAEQRIVRRDGAVRWILTIGRVLFEDGASRRSIGFWIDITERKAAELALRAANSDLERRVEERTHALVDKATQLERASRVKSEFLASMSHELRTPLNGIIGFTEFLHDEKPGPLLPKQKEYLNDVLDSARHLLELINEVLDIAKVEAGKIELHPSSFCVAQAIEDARTVIQGSADKKRIALRIEVAGGLDAVMLDPFRFKQVLYNLLSNAVKFSDEGARVEIHARRLAPNQLEVQVHDTGIGIKAADLGRLFTEFGRLDSGTARRAEGTGLGLALTKKLVELQGGCIGVQSVAGEGCVFTVVLPLVAVEAGQAGQADAG